MDYFEEHTTPTGVDGIKAIWVASDDRHIVDEVRTLAPAYFPNVISEAIVYVANGVTGGSNTTGVNTYTETQVCCAALAWLPHDRGDHSLHIPTPRLDAAEKGWNRPNAALIDTLVE